jgi:tripeptide aminopeptidase
MTIERNELIDTFVQLALINAPSLNERAVADEVKRRFTRYGFTVTEDATAAKINGNTGNLICLPPSYDPALPAIALCAHLDTVQPTEHLVPVVTEDRIGTDGTTILGGDDRLGVAVLTYIAKHLASLTPPVKNFICVFTVGEELGMYGANHVHLAPYNVAEAYILDCSKRPGIYIKDGAGCLIFTATFKGKAAHAGVAPEEGINAIALAAAGIAGVPFGRIDPETTSNVGRITGGGATNVVPDEVTVTGEVRSFTPEKIYAQFTLIKDSFQRAVKNGGSVTFQSEMDFQPYVHDAGSAIVQRMEKALRTAGLTPNGIRYTGGSDANSYNGNGVPAINIGTGAQKPHSFDEFILIEDLIKSTEIALALIQE